MAYSKCRTLVISPPQISTVLVVVVVVVVLEFRLDLKRQRQRIRFTDTPTVIMGKFKEGREVRDPLCFEFFPKLIVIHPDVLARMESAALPGVAFKFLFTINCLRSYDDLYIWFHSLL